MKIKNSKSHSILKEISKRKNLRDKYNEKTIKILLIKYKMLKDESARKKILEYCYPIIFTILSKIGKYINTNKKIFDNEDLFDESVITVSKCIESYDVKRNVKFITFIWVSIVRNLRRFLTNNYVDHRNHQVSSEEVFKNLDSDFESEDYIQKSVYGKHPEFQQDFEQDSLLECLNKKEKRIVKMKLNGIKVVTICRKLKLKQNQYYKCLESIKEKIQAENL